MGFALLAHSPSHALPMAAGCDVLWVPSLKSPIIEERPLTAIYMSTAPSWAVFFRGLPPENLKTIYKKTIFILLLNVKENEKINAKVGEKKIFCC